VYFLKPYVHPGWTESNRSLARSAVDIVVRCPFLQID